MKQNLPIIVTPGEPGGVGQEIATKAWKLLHSESEWTFILVTDKDWLATVQQRSGVSCPVQVVSTIAEASQVFATALPVLHRPLPASVSSGKFNSQNAAWVVGAVETAVSACLEGTASAMVTNPFQKEALYAAGFAHEGHTDFLGALARKHGHRGEPVMMLVGGGLRAVPVTVHIPLKEVSSRLSGESIEAAARIVDHDLRERFGIEQPRLAVTGLNPHAGENGAMGREEIEIIAPAISSLKSSGLDVRGPVPADTAFYPEMRETYDAILCMYHDQALIPVKALDFHGGVNVTLGLPFIRTSPDHGTAMNIAGTGKAHPDSLISAIKLAAMMARRGRKVHG